MRQRLSCSQGWRGHRDRQGVRGARRCLSALTTLKTLLGIPDDSRDALLTTIVSAVQARLLLLLGGASEVPESLAYIVPEVAVIRYNRIGSEGMSSHSVEGETVAYADNDFAGYMSEIEAYLDEQQTTKRGRVRFR